MAEGELLWSELYGSAGPDDQIVIMPGQNVILDQADVEVESILIMGGALQVADTQDSTLAAEWILVLGGGAFEVGAPDAPFLHEFTLELTGDNPNRDIDLSSFGMDMTIENNDAFLMAMGEGSRIEMHPADRAKESWAQLAGTVEAGETTLRFSERTNWEVGDLIAIASTDFEHDHYETRVIADVRNGGRMVDLEAPLEHRHYGEIETYDNGKTGQDAQSPDVDLRAEVGLLSRNVTVTGDENAEQDLFGGHTMVMEGAEM